MEQFYHQVFRRLREKFARDRLVDANSHVSDVFRVLVGADAKILDILVRLTGSGYQRLFMTVTGRLVPRPSP